MPVAVSVVLPKSHGAKKQAAATPTKTAELIVITEYSVLPHTHGSFTGKS